MRASADAVAYFKSHPAECPLLPAESMLLVGDGLCIYAISQEHISRRKTGISTRFTHRMGTRMDNVLMNVVFGGCGYEMIRDHHRSINIDMRRPALAFWCWWVWITIRRRMFIHA